MRSFEMPVGDTSAPTEYAGKEPEFEKGSVMMTFDGKKVFIVDYLKDKGLYVVGRADDSKIPFYRLGPDKLQKIEGEKMPFHRPFSDRFQKSEAKEEKKED